MKPPPFAYARASSFDDALDLLAEAGSDAKLIAGGQSLVPLLAYRLVRPSHLIDIDQVAGFDAIDVTAESVHIGALMRHGRLERAALPGATRLLAEAAALIGHIPIRMRGTLGGSLAHADPTAELPVACLALDAQVVARSRSGEREVGAESFFLGPFTTALLEGEAIVGIRIRRPEGRSAGAFTEFAVRAGDFAIVSAAVAITVGEDGRIERGRVALGGIAATPVRAREAERVLEAATLDRVPAVEAAEAALVACDLPEDVDGRHRRELVTVLVRDAIARVVEELAA